MSKKPPCPDLKAIERDAYVVSLLLQRAGMSLVGVHFKASAEWLIDEQRWRTWLEMDIDTRHLLSTFVESYRGLSSAKDVTDYTMSTAESMMTTYKYEK